MNENIFSGTAAELLKLMLVIGAVIGGAYLIGRWTGNKDASPEAPPLKPVTVAMIGASAVIIFLFLRKPSST